MRAFRNTLVLLTLGYLISQNVIAQAESTQLPSSTIECVEVSNKGVIAGEFDGRIWENPFNGVWLSRDMGDSWTKLGLAKRGVTDLKFKNSKIYATTYYREDTIAGLFKMNSDGSHIEHIGPNVSASNVSVADNTIYLGTYSHGLWISKDNGQTWLQKLGDGSGVTGSSITNLDSIDNFGIATTPTNLYITRDKGETWEEVQQLRGVQIQKIHISANMIYLGTTDQGIITSKDLGASWEEIATFNKKNVTDIHTFKDRVFVQADRKYMSTDFGATWEIVPEEQHTVLKDSATLFSYPSYIFSATQTQGITRNKVEPKISNEYRFLEIPWKTTSATELLDKVTAYFDHQLPLGGYAYHQENEKVNDTTLNFMGLNEHTPLLYYSGHNGTDFALEYGTEVIAPADGTASYYYCKACGHSIKIDHQNGYQSIYMHLQKDGLVTLDYPATITSGDVIGKVGMTGNTTGPHLHFAVMKDVNNNGRFDDFPDGMLDPFGWMNPYNTEPWSIYTWNDITGEHTGTQSSYLWKVDFDNKSVYVNSSEELVLGKNKIKINLKDSDDPFTTIISSFIQPNIPISQIELEYIEGTSISITAIDHQENYRSQLDSTITLSVNLSDLKINNVIEDTLKFYFWNPVEKKWHALNTLYNAATKILTAETKHLSHFAVLGEKDLNGYLWTNEAKVIQGNFTYAN